MKFFDYKFLILLALTLVVYFIYREVEYLRSKFEKLENEIKMIKFNDIQINNDSMNYPVLELPSNDLPDNNQILDQPIPNLGQTVLEAPINNYSSPKKIFVDLSQTINHNFVQNEKHGQNSLNNLPSEEQRLQMQQKINNIIEISDSDTDNQTTTDVSESSKHLAIYSNDNEQFDETQNSLLESIEASKNDVEFNYENMQTAEVKNTMDNIMNGLSSESDNNIILNEKNNDEHLISADQKSKIFFSDEQLSEEKQSKDLELNAVSEIENYDEKTLSNMKVVDLKKIAEKNKILLTKSVKGERKPKTKTELINDILQKFILTEKNI